MKITDKSKIAAKVAAAVPSVIPSQKELQVYTSDLPARRKITNQKSYDLAMTDYKLIGSISKELKKKKDSVLDPMKQAVKNLNAIFKPFEEQIEKAEADYKLVLNEWLQEQEAARIAALSKIENDKRLKNPVTILEKINEVGERAEGTFKVKVVKVVNLRDIPISFFDLNESRVLAAHKAGEEIAGVEIVEEIRVRR